MKITSLALASLLTLAAAPSAFAISSAPYATGSSYRGGQFWSWTLSSIQEARNFVYSQMRNANQTVDRETSGYYDTNNFNRGYMTCREYQYEVSGYGAQIFERAVDDVVRYNMTSCTLQVY